MSDEMKMETVETPPLNCTVPAIMQFGSVWRKNEDGTMGAVHVNALVQPYDQAQNRPDSRECRIVIQDLFGLAEGMAQDGDPELALAFEALVKAVTKIQVNGIPAKYAKFGRVVQNWEQ